MNKLIGGREFNKHEKILLSVVMGLSICFLYYIVFLGPNLTAIEPLVEEVKMLRDKAKNAENVQASISEKNTELEEIKKNYDEATKAVPKGDRYPELIKEIREGAKTRSLSITGEVFSQPVTYSQGEDGTIVEDLENTNTIKEGLLSYTITLSITGNFNNILKFVDDLEKVERIMSVDRIAVSDSKTDIILSYIVSGSDENEEYDFNNGSYGKDNLFQ